MTYNGWTWTDQEKQAHWETLMMRHEYWKAYQWTLLVDPMQERIDKVYNRLMDEYEDGEWYQEREEMRTCP